MSWGRLPRPNPCLPCMVGNPEPETKNKGRWSAERVRARNPGDCSIHIDMPKAHAAYGRGRTREVNANPKLMVVNPSGGLLGAIEQKARRRLTPREKSLLAQACKEFKEFHGREPKASDIVPVDAPPGTPIVVVGIGEELKRDYQVPFESERRGKWTHESGDHGRKRRTRRPWIAAIPGRKKHNEVTVLPKGADRHFKPTHGLMG